jgi:hypothetical protein
MEKRADIEQNREMKFTNKKGKRRGWKSMKRGKRLRDFEK